MSWPKVPFGKLCKLVNGKAFKTSDWSSKGLPIIRIQNLNDHEKKFNFWDGPLDKQVLVKKSDVLLAWSGTPGTSFGAHIWDRGDAVLNQHIFRVDLDTSSISKRWAIFTVNQQLYKLIGQSHGGVGLKHVTKGMVENLEIPLPGLAEQKRIVTILDKLGAIRRKRQQSDKLAEEFLRATFHHMFGDPVTNPKGWEEQQLHNIAGIASGVTKGRKFIGKKTVYIPYMRVANIQDGHVDLRDIKEIEVLETDIEKYSLRYGDILLTEGGDPDKLGRGAVWREEVKPCIHQNHIFRVRVDRSIIEPEYLSALIGSVRGKRYFLKAAKQTTGIASINMTQLKSFPALLPPIPLQHAYIDFLRRYENHLTSTNDLVHMNKDLFNSLTQRAFRGEL